MVDYDKEELKRRRPLNFIAIIIAIIFIFFGFYLINV
jgi:hypothetical protein|tara:strand:- start:887 stop:997 length:111 start_codon:yes stop_codon:yes gene_type:complete